MMRRIVSAGVVLLALVAGGCGTTVTQTLLLARKGDAEAIREAVLKLGELLAEKEDSGVPFGEGEAQAVEFLKEVSLKGRDVISRMRGLDALSRIPSVDATDIFMAAVQDSEWSVRWAGAKALVRRPSLRAAGVLVERLRAEPRAEVRLDLIKALGASGGEGALKALLDAFLDPTRRFGDHKLKLHAALVRLSGQELAFEDIEAWETLRKERFPEKNAAEKDAATTPKASGAGPGDAP
jgi:HEAT repeat protein